MLMCVHSPCMCVLLGCLWEVNACVKVPLEKEKQTLQADAAG